MEHNSTYAVQRNSKEGRVLLGAPGWLLYSGVLPNGHSEEGLSSLFLSSTQLNTCTQEGTVAHCFVYS